MKKIIITLIGLMIFASLPLALAVTLETGTIIDPTDSNTTYTLGNTISFSNVVINNVTPYFDDNIFSIEADSGNTAVVIYSLTLFDVTATDDVTFNLGGFTAYETYDIKVDGNTQAIVDSSSGGILSFVYTSWSTHTFSIVLHPSSSGSGGGDPTTTLPPSDVTHDENIALPLILIIIAIGVFVIIVLWRRKRD